MYELRIAYTPDATIGEGDVRSRHRDIEEAAKALVNCSAPCKQLIWLDEDGEPHWLDAEEEAIVAMVAAEHGYDVAEVGEDA